VDFRAKGFRDEAAQGAGMILLFSEGPADYRRYFYPYVVWARPEPEETPADLFEHGFLPGTVRLDRFYLCRNLRVKLGRYQPSSENRRILRKGEGIEAELVARGDYPFDEERRRAWLKYAAERFGAGIMSEERLTSLMEGAVISHLLRFKDTASGREVGAVLMYLEEPRVAYYYYSFYDLQYFGRSLGMHMMTRAVEFFARRGTAHLHLGTCYSERALYKVQFEGVEFFNGGGWSSNVEELKYLVRREGKAAHLLDEPEFWERFCPGGPEHFGGLRGLSPVRRGRAMGQSGTE
jgi:arginyl-tRNA--protein-N-Asp/Glu arginylyltransferase